LTTLLKVIKGKNQEGFLKDTLKMSDWAQWTQSREVIKCTEKLCSALFEFLATQTRKKMGKNHLSLSPSPTMQGEFERKLYS